MGFAFRQRASVRAMMLVSFRRGVGIRLEKYQQYQRMSAVLLGPYRAMVKPKLLIVWEFPDFIGPYRKEAWCPGKDSNLHASRHTDLNRARLPIPPPGQVRRVT